MQPLPKLILLLSVVVLAGACASFGSHKAEQSAAIEAPGGLGDQARMDVGILVFDRGLPSGQEKLPDRVYPGIRSAESYYFPCLLRSTLQRTNQWGDVFLAPRESGSIELLLRAEIVSSDGDRLVLDVEARDATRHVWLDKRYRTETTESDYYVGVKADPYQRMFNTIANDLVEARDRLAPERLGAVRDVAALRFAEEFAPEAFDGFLEPNGDGTLEPVRLPARGDPMMARVMQARSSEAMFVDTLNGHYENLCGGMAQSYLKWREHSRNEALMYRQAQRKKVAAIVTIPLVIVAAAAGAVATSQGANPAGATEAIALLGGLAVAQLYTKAKEYAAEASLHEAALEELDASFETEVEPMVVQTEGATHRITGSVDEQYEEWRRLLRMLYEAETGVLAQMDAHIERPEQEDAPLRQQPADALVPPSPPWVEATP